MIVVYFIICMVICHFLTRSKAIPFGWAFFFVFINPLIGVLLILFSGKYGYARKEKYIGSFYQQSVLVACVLFAIIFLYIAYAEYPNYEIDAAYSYNYAVRGIESGVYTSYMMEKSFAVGYFIHAIGFVGFIIYRVRDDGTYRIDEDYELINDDK